MPSDSGLRVLPMGGVFPDIPISEKMRLAGKTTEDELRRLSQQPTGSPLEEVGLAARAAYEMGVKGPLRVGGAALESAGDALGRGFGEVRKGFGATPSSEVAATVNPAKVPSTANPSSAVTPPTEEIIIPNSSMRAVRDASGRVTFTNTEQPGTQEIDYEAATSAIRADPSSPIGPLPPGQRTAFGRILPRGEEAGTLSAAPVARDDQGRTTMVPDAVLEHSRQQEVGDLSHKALVQQLTDQANPQEKVQRDIEVATKIADLLAPVEKDIQAQVEQEFKIAQALRPNVPPDALRQMIEQGIRDKYRDRRLTTIQEYLNKEHYPGQTLAGYGNQLRGEAADITGR